MILGTKNSEVTFIVAAKPFFWCLAGLKASQEYGISVLFVSLLML